MTFVEIMHHFSALSALIMILFGSLRLKSYLRSIV